MDRRDRRPPRASRPPSTQAQQDLPAYPDIAQPPPSQHTHYDTSPITSPRANVSFQNPVRPERGQRNPYQAPYDPEQQADLDPRVARKKSLVRPDREKIEPGHRQWHYRSHVAQAEDDGMGRVGVMPSSSFSLSYRTFYVFYFFILFFNSNG